ncbi:hypothetical protein HAX54_044738 [Datura stramonium]|uniref:Uncharacterized protein n=1 Tax=Datura stramonium TaxID=4076 RepID=A0ABS8SQ52_DATST|nr:hypothetical protein [Datura stramonium]
MKILPLQICHHRLYLPLKIDKMSLKMGIPNYITSPEVKSDPKTLVQTSKSNSTKQSSGSVATPARSVVSKIVNLMFGV